MRAPSRRCRSSFDAGAGRMVRAGASRRDRRQAAAHDVSARSPAPDLPRVRLRGHRRHDLQRDGGRLTAEELVKLMPNVGRYAQPEFEQFANVASSAAHARPVARARQAHQPDLQGRSRPRRHRRHQRHRHARRARLLPQPDRPLGEAGRRRRLDAQPEHARIRGGREPARRVPRRRGSRGGRPRRHGRPERRDQRRARGHQDRRAAAEHVPDPRLRRARRRRLGSRRVLPPGREEAHRPQRVRRHDASRHCPAWTS